MNAELKKMMEELDAIRDKIIEELMDLPADQFDYDTFSPRWTPVRRQLARFSDHLDEHVMQIARTRQAIGAYPTETQMVLADACAAHGALLGAVLGLTAEQMNQPAAEGEWSVTQILTHVLNSQKGYLARVHEGREKKQPYQEARH